MDSPRPSLRGRGNNYIETDAQQELPENGFKTKFYNSYSNYITIGTIIYNTCVLSNYLISPPPPLLGWAFR